tara:strand:+ start:421 stop:909 length:489 start_codon:yes stop_codon:yes gene_type:complete
LLIGVTGDTHNNLKNISKICEIFNKRKVSLVIHTGDITLPKSLKIFSELKMPLIGVFGNNDEEEKSSLLLEAERFNCKLYEEPHRLEIQNIKILIVHHPELISVNDTKKYDFIFHGHTHRYRSEKINECIVFNPGECAGFMKGKNLVGVIDLKKKIAKTIPF